MPKKKSLLTLTIKSQKEAIDIVNSKGHEIRMNDFWLSANGNYVLASCIHCKSAVFIIRSEKNPFQFGIFGMAMEQECLKHRKIILQ